MVAFVFYTCVQSHAASGLAAPIFDAISIVSCCKRRSRYSAIHTFSMCRCACAYTLFGSGARRFVFLCALAQIMDAIFAKAKKISDSVFAADTKAETTFDQDDNLPSWKKILVGRFWKRQQRRLSMRQAFRLMQMMCCRRGQFPRPCASQGCQRRSAWRAKTCWRPNTLRR
jgi:hypothetical protein